MKVKILDASGKKVGEVNLKKEVFGLESNPPLISQYVYVYLANQRMGTASTKTRGEVSGGGRKPWRQKGTGRARHGSIRSPIWVHGGVAHGPKPRDYSLKMPKKMRRLALFSALSNKAKNKRVIVLKGLNMKMFSTKKLKEIVSRVTSAGKIGIVMPETNLSIIKSAKNIPGIFVWRAQDLNAYMVSSVEALIFEKESLKVLYDTYGL